MEFRYYDEILLSIASIHEFTNIEIKRPKSPRFSKTEIERRKLTQKYDSNPIPEATGKKDFSNFEFRFRKDYGLQL